MRAFPGKDVLQTSSKHLFHFLLEILLLSVFSLGVSSACTACAACSGRSLHLPAQQGCSAWWLHLHQAAATPEALPYSLVGWKNVILFPLLIKYTMFQTTFPSVAHLFCSLTYTHMYFALLPQLFSWHYSVNLSTMILVSVQRCFTVPQLQSWLFLWGCRVCTVFSCLSFGASLRDASNAGAAATHSCCLGPAHWCPSAHVNQNPSGLQSSNIWPTYIPMNWKSAWTLELHGRLSCQKHACPGLCQFN